MTIKGIESCTHCGQCCLSIACQLGQVLFKMKEVVLCPALEEDNGLYYCGLISNTSKYVNDLVGNEEWKALYLSQAFGRLLGIGYGCGYEIPN